MNGGIVYNQLLAVRHQALALAQGIDLMLQAMEAEAQKTAPSSDPLPEPSQPDTPSEAGVDGACGHPKERRVPLPVMGRKKFKCSDCNEDVFEEEA